MQRGGASSRTAPFRVLWCPAGSALVLLVRRAEGDAGEEFIDRQGEAREERARQRVAGAESGDEDEPIAAAAVDLDTMQRPLGDPVLIHAAPGVELLFRVPVPRGIALAR